MVYVYVLQLEQNKYYVGKTSNPQARLISHFKSVGSRWTKKYKPIKLLELIEKCDDYDEDKYTLKYMSKYGVNNVRGGSFSMITLTNEIKRTIQIMINGSEDRCFKCQKNGHFGIECNVKLSTNLEDSTDSENRVGCRYCIRTFDTKRGTTQHENLYCKHNYKICRQCEGCKELHRNRKDNFCNDCRLNKNRTRRTTVKRTPTLRTTVKRTPTLRTTVKRTPTLRTKVKRTKVKRTPTRRTTVKRTQTRRTTVKRTQINELYQSFWKTTLMKQTLKFMDDVGSSVNSYIELYSNPNDELKSYPNDELKSYPNDELKSYPNDELKSYPNDELNSGVHVIEGTIEKT